MSSCRCKISPIISYFLFSLFFIFFAFPVKSLRRNNTTQNFRGADHETKMLNRIRAQLMKINKPAVKTIQSPDGNIIDCVWTHEQPTFDHPLLQGQKPLDPPEWPKGYEPTTGILDEHFQVWSMSNETCPDGTIPIRRATEQDLLIESSMRRFRRNIIKRPSVGRYGSRNTHERAVVFVDETEYYGAKASMSVWAPYIANKKESSISQLWITAGNPGTGELNSIEAGWRASRSASGDSALEFFVYWTRDSYATTGCYNLHCSGFVQTNNRVVLGGALPQTSSYNGPQIDIDILVFKDPEGNWWLSVGKGGIKVGYWPSSIFTHLKEHAEVLFFGGEITNLATDGSHTSTQMGSGHFAEEGYQKAAYFRKLSFVDKSNSIVIIPRVNNVAMTHSNCYDVQTKFIDEEELMSHFYYGGPGKNKFCP